MDDATPWGDDGATITCPVCQSFFAPSGRKRFCSDACRRLAWKRQHQAAPVPVVVPPPGQPRRPLTVYECATCGIRAVGEQRCADCGTFMIRVGLGGHCPACDEPVAVADLIAGEVMSKPVT